MEDECSHFVKEHTSVSSDLSPSRDSYSSDSLPTNWVKSELVIPLSTTKDTE